MGASFVNVEPRPAATVILLREPIRGVGAEVLLLERSLALEFASGAFVFPGGAVDVEDSSLYDVCEGVTEDEACHKLKLDSDGLKFYVAAIRECFEEAGILLAASASEPKLNSRSGHLRLDDLENKRKYENLRQALNSRKTSFNEIVRQNDLALTVADLHYVSHWITPEGRSRRYDTRFFLTLLPRDQEALHDNREAVASVWITPKEALFLYERREINLVFPTIRNLQQLEQLESAAEIMAWASSLEDIRASEPRIIDRGGISKVALPGEDL